MSGAGERTVIARCFGDEPVVMRMVSLGTKHAQVYRERPEFVIGILRQYVFEYSLDALDVLEELYARRATSDLRAAWSKMTPVAAAPGEEGQAR